MAGVGAAFELFGNPPEGEAQVFFFAQLSRLFACQARPSRRYRGSRIFLLGLDRLALPASSHALIIAVPTACRLWGSCVGFEDGANRQTNPAGQKENQRPKSSRSRLV